MIEAAESHPGSPGSSADAVIDDDVEDTSPAGWTVGDFLLSGGALVAFLGGWELAVWIFSVPPIVLPPPTKIAAALWAILFSGMMYRHLGITVTEILSGFIIGAATALVLGSLIAQFRAVDRIFYPYLVALQAVPKVALAPLLVIWFGFGMQSKILMTAVICFFPVLVNTVVGLRAVDQERVDLMIALDASRWQIFRYVRLPSALPFIFAGLDVGIVLAVIGAIVGEFAGASGGIGYLLLVYDSQLQVASLFALLVILGVLGVTLHSVVQFAQRRATFWMQTGADRPMAV